MSYVEDYLPRSRKYFRSFIDSNLSDFFMDMKECRTGPSSGYPRFHRDNEVIDCMRSIYHNLDETFSDLSIPNIFTSPQNLIETWFNFKNYLESKTELFSDATTKTIEMMRASTIINSEFSDADLLPFPLLQANSVRLKVLDVLNHILCMDEVKIYTESASNSFIEVGDNLRLARNLCYKFHLVALQLKRRHSNRNTLDITDEYDVQDLFHAILKIHFDDVRAEEYTPSYAGGASRIDFILKNEKVAIELKKTRESLGAKEVGDQLLIDIGRYGSHPDCKNLICFVYDPDHRIANPSAIENDLSGLKNGLNVEVIIIPKGH